ncbi:FecR domain-containing protein [Maribacter sp. CXY002]|uniref:FecR family protein n=1 Tax=Maribacter luteocoastalis TaxID=3407671 RepID=UPI003B66E306
MNYSKKIIVFIKLMTFSLCIFCCACDSDTLEMTTKENYEVAHLPDGSVVYLNHNSTIRHAKEFNPRVIELKGEAFFIVQPDGSEFLVTTEFGDIEVLGTEFNVKTTVNQVEVDVKNGLVALKTAYNNSEIKKGAKAVYKEGEKTVRQLKSNEEFKKWTQSLKREFKKLGKDIKPVLKNVGKEFKKVGKEIGDEFKK